MINYRTVFVICRLLICLEFISRRIFKYKARIFSSNEKQLDALSVVIRIFNYAIVYRTVFVICRLMINLTLISRRIFEYRARIFNNNERQLDALSNNLLLVW